MRSKNENESFAKLSDIKFSYASKNKVIKFLNVIQENILIVSKKKKPSKKCIPLCFVTPANKDFGVFLKFAFKTL